MTHGVCRVDKRGLPVSVLQKEEEINTLKVAAQGKVQAAVLKNDAKGQFLCGLIFHRFF